MRIVWHESELLDVEVHVTDHTGTHRSFVNVHTIILEPGHVRVSTKTSTRSVDLPVSITILETDVNSGQIYTYTIACAR